MIKTAFVGFEHPHMTGLYNELKCDPQFEITGAFEPDIKARKNAEEKGIIFSDEENLTLFLKNTPADVIAVGSHYTARGKVIIEALKNGKHIIADKPLCTEPEEIKEIRAIANEKGLAVCLLLSLRKGSSIISALDFIKKGNLGRINNIIFEGEHPLNYGTRADWYFEGGKHGGVINDIAIHGIDIVRQFTGSDVESIIGARVWNFYAKETPGFLDSAQFIVKMKSGAGVMADVSYSAPSEFGYSHPSYWHFRIFGEKGMLDFREGSQDITFYPAKGEIIKLNPIQPQDSLISEFVNLPGDKSKIVCYNNKTFDSTEQTIMIQKAADNSEH